MDKKNTKSRGRRTFLRNFVFTSTGVIIAPSLLTVSSSTCGSSIKNAVYDAGNLIYNGDFELSDHANSQQPAGWEVGPQSPGEAVSLTPAQSQTGSQSLLQRRTVTDHYFQYLRQHVDLKPGAIYRLRFYARANDKASDMFAVCISASGAEGPAWLYQPVHLDSGKWQDVDIVFRAQSGFSPLHEAGIEFRLNQWRPDFSYRPNRTQDRDVEQLLYIDSVSLVEIGDGTRVPARLSCRWLLVPGHDDLRMSNAELSLGDGVSMVPGSLMLRRNGHRIRQVDFLEDILGPGQFAWSDRSRRLYVHSDDIKGSFDLNYEAITDHSGNASLGISSLGSRALGHGTDELTVVSLDLDVKDFDRINWPVTQGLPFPVGTLADLSSLRLLGPDGAEVPLQVRATSYWADDSVRWALLDFCIDAPRGQAPSYSVEFGPGISPSDISGGVIISDNGDALIVDGGRVQFRVSKNRFELLEDLVVDGHRPLEGPAALSVSDQGGKVYTCSGVRPYNVTVEEQGPLRSVIAVHGWNADSPGDCFLTYTTRIHVYRNQPFVRVFHTLTNRHQEQYNGRHRFARGWPDDESMYQFRELPQRNISDASLRLKPEGITRWSFVVDGDSVSGDVGEGPSVHRQVHHDEGIFTTPRKMVTTGVVPGVVSIEGTRCTLTVGVFRYSNLFPKEMRISAEGLELGLIPFSTSDPHPLLKGTARTTELLLSFDPPGSNSGLLSSLSFTQPTIFSNQEWYCASHGFMGDPLIPVNKHTIGTYDRIMNSYVDNCLGSYPKGVDDCGIMNFGDFTYTGSNVWLNLEYDGDLGLYIHFARSGNHLAFKRGVDASRHFLDSDTGWYTGDFDTHGSNFRHNSAHYGPGRPDGHIYTLGLIHYYFLTGDRRGLEATRMASDCINRVLYHRIHQYASLFTEDDPVGPKRGYNIPGGPWRSPNSRNTSDPSRYSLHSYLGTGEARFLEASISLAESLILGWPEVWRTDDDQYIHYRWPQVIGRLYDITGYDHFRDVILKCGKWMMEDPYSKYGEFHVSQSYGMGPQLSGINNTRMLFLTAWSWKITGERKYLDWMINIFDGCLERDRHTVISRTDGKSLGKEADNPARGAAWVVPHRTVLIEHSPSRFQFVPPARGEWKLSIGNTSETPLRGRLAIGQLPHGVEMERSREFELALGQEITIDFPVSFTDDVETGRITIPYRITTLGTDGREGERNSFFAAHLLRPRTEEVPELVFHAPLDDTSPAYSYGGSGEVTLERDDFVPGRFGGKAFGANSEGWSFDLSGSIFADAGTFSIWVKPENVSREHALFRIRGHGWPFIGIFTHHIVACNQPYNFQLSDKAGEWIHIAIRWDLNELSYFIDGKSVFNEIRVNYEIPAGGLWALPQGAASFDDMRIFSVPLSDNEILEISKG